MSDDHDNCDDNTADDFAAGVIVGAVLTDEPSNRSRGRGRESGGLEYRPPQHGAVDDIITALIGLTFIGALLAGVVMLLLAD